ncbi:MAG: DNA-3-methyladenine glycosylase [Cyclobacteriaceae bacterium]|nr:DNA-3-methyladenine glycosylase [Cyclobacteriaceae bacterium]
MSNANTTKLDISWYLSDSVEEMARELLGKYLCTNIDGNIVKGMIVETEAYCGRDDKACHTNNNRRTKRNEIMYASGGHAYVYLCYGIHHLFNVVTNREGYADAVLIRALEPVLGMEPMMLRRNMIKPEKRLTSGPGALSQAMGISLKHYGQKLIGDEIWIEKGQKIHEKQVGVTTRVGVQYAGEDALKLWRFYVKDNGWVSKI